MTSQAKKIPKTKEVISEIESVDFTEIPATPETEAIPSPEIIETDKWIEAEILFRIEKDDTTHSLFDFTDALIKIDTITSIERLNSQRLYDFGISESFIEDYDINESQICLIYSSSYPDGVILVDHSYESITKMLVSLN